MDGSAGAEEKEKTQVYTAAVARWMCVRINNCFLSVKATFHLLAR